MKYGLWYYGIYALCSLITCNIRHVVKMPLFKSLNVSKKHFCFTFNLYLPISQTQVKPN